MRNGRYVTMLDPFQERYGRRIGALMYLPAFVGELLWAACILGSMGTSLSVIVEVPFGAAVAASAAIAVSYTFFGGQYSVRKFEKRLNSKFF